MLKLFFTAFKAIFVKLLSRNLRKRKENEAICCQTPHKLDCFTWTTSQMTNLTWHHLSLDVIMFNFTLSSFFGVSCTGKLLSHRKTKLFVILYLLFSVNSHGASTAYTSPYHKLGLNVESGEKQIFHHTRLIKCHDLPINLSEEIRRNKNKHFEWQRRRRMETTRNKLLSVSDCNLWMKHSKSPQIQRIACRLKFPF